jgi:subfamily B ATP-binding cassette protein MsbA
MTSPKASSLSVYKRLLGYVRPYWFIFALSLLGFLLFAATQPAFAAIMREVVDGLQQGGRNREHLRWVPLTIIAVMLVRGAGSFLGNYYIAKVSNSIIHTLRCQLFQRYTLLPARYFDDNNSGHLLSRITYNVTQVTAAATDAVKVVVREGLTVIGLLVYLLYLNWRLSLIFIAVAPLIGFLVLQTNRRFRKISKKIQAAMGDVTHVASELISGHRVVRVFGGEEYENRRFETASLDNFRQSMRMVRTGAVNTPLLQLIVTMALAAMIYLALQLMSDASAGEFVAYLTAAILVPKPMRQLSEVSSNIQKGITAAESIFEVLDEPPERDTGRLDMERAAGHLEFRNLSFAYPGSDKMVLRGIDFIAEPGQTVALVGHSGSGKSTLVNLIPRFHDHESGQILLDGVEIGDYTLRSLRRQIAFVTQQVTLFNDTVANNIAYGALSGAARVEIERAAREANALEFIERLPQGLDTPVGENGVKLSGGQRQRLAIARALLKNAPLLILDEATSSLDTGSERKIQQALDMAMRGRTTLVIAHRLSTVENADLILVMDQGRIVERGRHAELLARDGVYAQLYRMQFRDAPAAVADV